MEDDQQFCLRWNNHQSTLISVFDTLLENQTLVDCTLAAEGKFLKAHKVVLSACSPFFATLLQQQYDKHPIFILKDVKYQELRAMMDYMYRGEVNISQDQLAALLKAAESLQIKGLSDNRSGSTPKTEQHRGLNVPGSGSSIGGGGKLSGYTLEQTQSKRPRVGPSPMETADISGSREGSSSPSRRRRKVRRRSVENAMSADIHDNSNSSQINQSSLQPQQQQQPQTNASLTGVGALAAATSSLPVSASALSTGSSGVLAATGSIVSTQGTTQQMTTNITKKTESVKGASDAMNSENIPTVGVVGTGDEQNVEHLKSEKSNHKQKSSAPGVAGKETAEMVIEPKSEYEEEGNEETVEDLTLDDEEMGMDDLDQNAGTSQAGEGSSQGYAPWQHDRSQDELLLAPQEAQQRDPQDLRTLYNIATAAAAVVAAASASSNAVHMHNNINNSTNNNNNNNNNSNYNKQRQSSISKERNECAKHSELLVAKNRLLTGLTAADVTSALPAAYAPVGAMSSAATPPTQSPAPPNVNKLLCDVLEPEISIRSMYKCCGGGGKRFLQQAQTQQQQQHQQQPQKHLHIIQPHAMTNAVAVAAAAAATITPPPLTTTTTSQPTHATTTCCTPTSSSHHSNCSGCQITAAASIQLANLIGSTMLLPQTAAAMQDVATKAVVAAGATVNVTSEHNASKKLHAANTAENLLCRGGGGNSVLEAVSSASAGSSSNLVSPHTVAATTKKANVQFHCEFCAFACSWKYDLKLHLRQKHGIHNKKM